MGLKCSPDITQSKIESVLFGIDDAEVYIDDVGAFSKDWDYQVQLLATILHHLYENGFTINPLKFEWAIQETNRLGYWLTQQGLTPRKKKIEAILHMDCPRNAMELCMFIGCINYFCDMWPSCAHILKPLTDHSSLKKSAPIQLTDEMQHAFDKMHALMAANALTAYPDHNKWFDIYTDASYFQLHTCKVQESRLVVLMLQAVKVAAKQYHRGERDAFHCYYPQRML
ncbi:hypothetical protein ACHAW6_002847 [Cyclotella cf. meneghiniana]